MAREKVVEIQKNTHDAVARVMLVTGEKSGAKKKRKNVGRARHIDNPFKAFMGVKTLKDAKKLGRQARLDSEAASKKKKKKKPARTKRKK